MTENHLCALLDVNATSTPGYINHSSPGSDDSVGDVTVSSTTSSSNTDDIQLDSQQLVPKVTRIYGPVLVINDASTVAVAQRYTLDVLFHHSGYISASRCRDSQ